MILPGSRLDFEESWLKLYEMPMGIGDMNIYQSLLYSISKRIEYNPSDVVDCGNDLFKITGKTIEYYWLGKDFKIIAELTISAQSTIVNAVAKKYSGSEPYASDFYIAILNDISEGTRQSLRFQSDTKLTQSGLKIWKRLIEKGYVVSVYNSSEPGRSFNPFKNENDLLDFYRLNDANYQKYQYVLSKPGVYLGEVHSVFNTRRMRELSNNL